MLSDSAHVLGECRVQIHYNITMDSVSAFITFESVNLLKSFDVTTIKKISHKQ